MKRILFVAMLFFISVSSIDAKTLSPQAKVYLMTVGPYYNDFASVWGHVALLIKDESNNIDIVYNYGGAAYGKAFMLKLISGQLRFYLDVGQTYDQELKTYERAERDVDLYELNLSYKEKNRLFNYLQTNAKEENKYYRYEFYLKNCATFTYDAISKNIEGELVYAETTTDKTYRGIFDAKLDKFPWTNFFIRIVAGMKNDRVLNLTETFFVPKNMISNMKNGKIVNGTKEKPILLNSKVIFDFPDKKFYYDFYKTPLFPILILLFLEIILFSFSYVNRKIYLGFYDSIWFLIASLLSVFAILTMFFTHYVVTKWNFNVLWANPLFILTFLLKGERKILLFKVLSSFLVFTLIGSLILPQHFYPEILVLVVILLLKTLKYGFLNNKFNA